MSYPDVEVCDALARRILVDIAFTASDLTEQERTAVIQWVAAYPGPIRTAARDLAEALFAMLAGNNLDAERVAVSVINAAYDAATIIEACDRRARDIGSPDHKPDAEFMSWLKRELARDLPPEEQPIPGKHALPAVVYGRLRQESALAGSAPPNLYASEEEEEALLRRLLADVAKAEPYRPGES